MLDIVFVFVTIAFFAISAAYVGACARIIGREELSGPGAPEPEALDGIEVGGVRR
ncbi:MAG: hypothetical protein ACRD0K_13170 [Egibacteraceae bacterium]